MGRVNIVLPDELENRLRNHLRKKGDLSNIIVEALEDWLKKQQ